MGKRKRTKKMIEIKTMEFSGFVSAFSALRLPHGKEERSRYDRETMMLGNVIQQEWVMMVDEKDKKLMQNLVLSGDEHAKVVRGILVYAKITAPMYWWCELETYRAGHERLCSSSTMHIDGKGMTPEEVEDMKAKMPAGKMLTKVDFFSYQCLRKIYKQRKNHRLQKTWGPFCEWIESLPMAKDLILVERDKEKEKENE